MLSDTHPEAAQAQIELLRRATNAERFEHLCVLTEMARGHAKRAIRRAHPQLSPREREWMFIEVHYGVDLARRVREYSKDLPE